MVFFVKNRVDNNGVLCNNLIHKNDVANLKRTLFGYENCLCIREIPLTKRGNV